MTDEAQSRQKTIRYSVRLQSDPQNGDLVRNFENSQLVWLHDDLPTAWGLSAGPSKMWKRPARFCIRRAL